MYYALKTAKTFIFGSYSLPDPDFEQLRKQHIDVLTVSNAGHSMAWENPEGLAATISRAIPKNEASMTAMDNSALF